MAEGRSKWLTYREENPQLLEGLIKAGFRSTVMTLARARVISPSPGSSSRRSVGSRARRRMVDVRSQSERRSRRKRPGKVSLKRRHLRTGGQGKAGVQEAGQPHPQGTGLTRAIMAAAIESGCLSNKDLIIATPTIEELGLMTVQASRIAGPRP